MGILYRIYRPVTIVNHSGKTLSFSLADDESKPNLKVLTLAKSGMLDNQFPAKSAHSIVFTVEVGSQERREGVNVEYLLKINSYISVGVFPTFGPVSFYYAFQAKDGSELPSRVFTVTNDLLSVISLVPPGTPNSELLNRSDISVFYRIPIKASKEICQLRMVEGLER